MSYQDDLNQFLEEQERLASQLEKREQCAQAWAERFAAAKGDEAAIRAIVYEFFREIT